MTGRGLGGPFVRDDMVGTSPSYPIALLIPMLYINFVCQHLTTDIPVPRESDNFVQQAVV